MKFKLYILALLVISITYYSCSESNPVTPPVSDHFVPDGVWVKETAVAGDTTYYYVNDRTNPFPTGDSVFTIHLNTSKHYTVYFLDSNRSVLPYPSSSDLWLAWLIQPSDTSKISLSKNNPRDWSFNLTGRQVSTAFMRLQVFHIDHADFTTPFIRVYVTP